MLDLVSSALYIYIFTTYLQWVSNNETQENWTKKVKSQCRYTISPPVWQKSHETAIFRRLGTSKEGRVHQGEPIQMRQTSLLIDWQLSRTIQTRLLYRFTRAPPFIWEQSKDDTGRRCRPDP